MNKSKVKALQQELADAGVYTGTIDGLWGPKSEAAKTAWEKANNKPFQMDNFVPVDSIGGHTLNRYQSDSGAYCLFTKAGATVDADGGPHAYHPTNDKLGLDYLANAGHPGNWWGVVTKNGKFVLQGPDDPAPGFCISTTSLKVKDATTLITQQVNAESVPFIVLPGRAPFAKLGDYGTIWWAKMNKIVHILFADVGPRTHWGEISYKTAQILAFENISPKDGGLSDGLFYFVYPNTSHATGSLIEAQYLTQDSIDANASAYWSAFDKNAILAFYGILDHTIIIPK